MVAKIPVIMKIAQENWAMFLTFHVTIANTLRRV
jgi:hypothetical protein